jgi:hypothetical protein
MDTIIPDPKPGLILLLIAPAQVITPTMLDIVARLAVEGPVDVIDGGNCFNAYRVARQVRRQSLDFHAVLHRVRVARAFTCYQMASLMEGVPAAGTTTIVLDLLSLFYDENVPLPEAARLLKDSLAHLCRLSEKAPVAVSAHPPQASQADRLALVAQLQDSLDGLSRSLIFEQPQSPPPLRLF